MSHLTQLNFRAAVTTLVYKRPWEKSPAPPPPEPTVNTTLQLINATFPNDAAFLTSLLKCEELNLLIDLTPDLTLYDIKASLDVDKKTNLPVIAVTEGYLVSR